MGKSKKEVEDEPPVVDRKVRMARHASPTLPHRAPLTRPNLQAVKVRQQHTREYRARPPASPERRLSRAALDCASRDKY